MSGVLRWEDPPAPDKRGTRGNPKVADWWRVAAQLRSRPGVWALVAEGASTNTASWIRGGRMAAFTPAGSFDAVGRRIHGDYVVYARYVGGES